MWFFLIIALFILLICFCSIYEYYIIEKEEIKKEVENDYKYFLKYIELQPKVLQWFSTLNDRFEAFAKSEEYKTVKPYDKFALNVPTKYHSVLAFMVVDKKRNLKFTVNFEPSPNDSGRTDKYLKYCVGYNNGLKEFIKYHQKVVMEKKLEKKRIKNVESIINK